MHSLTTTALAQHMRWHNVWFEHHNTHQTSAGITCVLGPPEYSAAQSHRGGSVLHMAVRKGGGRSRTPAFSRVVSPPRPPPPARVLRRFRPPHQQHSSSSSSSTHQRSCPVPRRSRGRPPCRRRSRWRRRLRCGVVSTSTWAEWRRPSTHSTLLQVKQPTHTAQGTALSYRPATIVQIRPRGLRMESLSEAPVASSMACTAPSCAVRLRPNGSGNSSSAPHFLALQQRGWGVGVRGRGWKGAHVSYSPSHAHPPTHLPAVGGRVVQLPAHVQGEGLAGGVQGEGVHLQQAKVEVLVHLRGQYSAVQQQQLWP